MPVSMRSPLPAEIVAQRINESTPSWWAFIIVGVSGYVRFGHLRLSYRGTIFDYNAMTAEFDQLPDPELTGGQRR